MKVLERVSFAMILLIAFSLQGCHKENSNENEEQEENVYPDSLIVTVNGVSFNMIHVIGGTFIMGSQHSNHYAANYDTDSYDWEAPVHFVRVGNFYMAETEVTQALWKAMMGVNPSHFIGDSLPVETVNWKDCKQFIQALNEMSEYHFFLPTEAQWEYAARGGNMSLGCKYSGSNQINNVAWYNKNDSGNFIDSTHFVATKQANELGLYDMSGNVWEWCNDYFGDYPDDDQDNPSGPETGNKRVIRGGSWGNVAQLCRVAYRGSYYENILNDNLGLRLAMYK